MNTESLCFSRAKDYSYTKISTTSLNTKLRKLNFKIVRKDTSILSQKNKIKQTFINQSLQRITMHAGHILTILIGFYASFAVTVMSVTPLLG